MLTTFIKYVNTHEDWLMARILGYAKKRDYTKYTSTLKEAWRLSISGLSSSLVGAVQTMTLDLELGPDQEYTGDPATQFGIMEAMKHRERGVRLDMFLGLMKYYHQASIVAERLRSNLSKLELSVNSGTLVTFTVSIGLTVVDNKDAAIDDIIKKADEALYQTKQEGRNRVALQQ